MWMKWQNKIPFIGSILILFVSGVFAAADLSKWNGFTTYYRIVNRTQPVTLWATCGTEDATCKKDPTTGEKILVGKEFYVFIPEADEKEASSKKLELKLRNTADAGKIVHHLSAVQDSDSGKVVVNIKGLDTVTVHIGVSPDKAKVNPLNVVSFFAPQLQYCEDKDCNKIIDGDWSEQLEVDEPKEIFVQTINPYTKDPVTDLRNTERYLYFTPSDPNLVFLNSAGDPMKAIDVATDERVLLDSLENGKGSFFVSTKKAASSIDFETNMLIKDGGTADFFVTEPFPGSLGFKNHDLPSLDSAFIFDTNGDGVGDSIAAYFNGKLENIEYDNYQYNWPNSGDFKPLVGDLAVNGGVHSFSGVVSTLPNEVGAGSIKVDVHSTASGKDANLETKLKDKIGPVIQAATLTKGNNTMDTLVLHFNKDIDPSWTKGAGYLLNGNPISMEAVKKDGDVWTFVVPSDAVKAGDEIEIAVTCETNKCPDGLVKAADGNKTGKNNPVKISNSGQNYEDDKNSGFWDTDGNGRMDQATLGFQDPITKEELKDMEVTLYWVDNKGNVLEIKPDLSDSKRVHLSDDGKILYMDIDTTKYDVRNMLTNIDTVGVADSLKYGYAEVVKKVTSVDGTVTTEPKRYSMNDRMSPVISGTFLQPESFQRMEADVLKISFSEPIDQESISASDLSDCFSFLVNGEWVSLPFSDMGLKWSSDGKSVEVLLETGVKLSKRLNPSDSIRFDNTAAKLKDLSDNGLSGLAPVVMVEGNPRVLMETTSMATLSQAEKLPEGKAVAAEFYRSASEVEQGLGVMMDISFATAMEENGAGLASMNLKEVGLKWELDVFTNLGAFVASDGGTILCDDENFNGNCFENARKLYLRWNMRSNDGRRAGVGVYVAKFKVKVFGAKNPTAEDGGEAFKVERIYKWGLRAGKPGKIK